MAAEVIDLKPSALSLLMDFLEQEKDNVEDVVCIVTFRDDLEEARNGTLLHTGIDVKTLCYMQKILEQVINFSMSNQIDPHA